MESLFTPLREEGLTYLLINWDWKKETLRFEAQKEWESDLDFSRYNKDWMDENILTDDVKLLNTKQVLEMYEKYGLTDYLMSVVDLLKQGHHYGIKCFYNAKHDIRFMCNIHSWKLGLKNRQHATLSGGIRRHFPEEREYDVIIDGLNLGRGSTFKAIAGGVPYGGSKTTVIMPPLDVNDMDVMGFIAYALDRCRVHTGPDMNFPAEMADVMQENFSMQFTGGPKDVLGPTGNPTAYGTYKTMKQAVKFVYGGESLDGKRIGVMGLGAVGWNMVKYLGQEKVKLYVADINAARAQQCKEEYADLDITVVDLKDFMDLDVDIMCPSAIGGIFDDETIAGLKCKIIWGAANNQLKASSQEEEYRLARLIADRGILFQTEWWHNAAGLITGSEAFYLGKNATFEGLLKRIDSTLPESTWKNLNEAKEKGITPTECAYQKCENMIYGGDLWN